MTTRRITLAIEGLGCGAGGALTVERALAHVPGVGRATVNPATEMAYIEYNRGEASPTQLMQAVAKVGFQASELGPRAFPERGPIIKCRSCGTEVALA